MPIEKHENYLTVDKKNEKIKLKSIDIGKKFISERFQCLGKTVGEVFVNLQPWLRSSMDRM